jgi:argininosuccinate lyase
MSKKMWGGRFDKKMNPLVEEFTKSIQYDYKLAKYDVIGSIVHVQILKKAGYLTIAEASRLTKALKDLYDSIINDKFRFDSDAEDVHTNIQNELQRKVGDLALKLHTARSRNDQVALATRLYCQTEVEMVKVGISKLMLEIGGLANKNKQIIIPGLTHLQHAQPVYLKDYLFAYIEMLKRDYGRLDAVSENIKLTMGAGALAGTPIASNKYGKNATINSIDAVSDRDFVIDVISALSILGMHLSRLAEDFIIWATKEFDFIEIDDAFCTGSSLMPQKKNPDVLELIRGYAGRVYGNLISVLTMMKGLPLTYNRDMQLDKEPLFNSLDIILGELEVLSGVVKSLRFNKSTIQERLKDESLYATDLVYYLVDKGAAFKNAHNIIGRLVKYSIDNSIEIKQMPENLLRKFSDRLVKKEIIKLFNPEVSVKSKRSIKRTPKR